MPSRVRALLIGALAAAAAGCATADASCGFDLRAADPAPGERVGNLTPTLLQNYPSLAEAVARPYDDGGGTVACERHRPMMEDVLALGGTGAIEDDHHGHALVGHEGRTWRITWTIAPGGEL